MYEHEQNMNMFKSVWFPYTTMILTFLTELGEIYICLA